ncbi:PilZ domain-containing protein [Novosphingopyxis sp.]|uniref:PilZ domain-containing protein n=1 Tax=Novosphingopyxis sp. TaxID=2709690 RepID=UPI003B5A7958
MTKPFLPPFDSEPDGAPHRDKDRDSLFLQAVIRIPGKCDETSVRIRNLSSGGLMAEAPVEVERGDIVHIDLRNVGDVTGKVAWKAEGRFGIAFDRPIDPKQVRQPVGSKDERPNFLKKLDMMGRPRSRKPY